MKPTLVFLLLLTLNGVAYAHESPVDHVERELRLWIMNGDLRLIYRIQQTERATLMELKEMDANANGKVSDAEVETFFAKKAKSIAEQFVLTIDHSKYALIPVGKVETDTKLGQTYSFVSKLPNLSNGTHKGELLDGFSRQYPGSYRWKRPLEDDSNPIQIRPVGQPDDSDTHPEVLDLHFEILVPTLPLN